MAITLIVTTAGRDALVNAANTGTAPVNLTQIGLSETAVTATADLTALAGEIKRIAGIGGSVVADDTIHVVATDESADVYSLRSFALYLDDGTLFALYGQADPILEKSAGSFAALAVDVAFADIAAADLTFGDTDFLLPTATTERQGIVELATVAEAQAGIDALRALTPAAAKAAILGWLLTQDGSGSSLDADFVRGLHWTSGQNVSFGVGDFHTPNSGTAGGLRLHANGTTLFAYLEFLNPAGSSEHGFLRSNSDGELYWSGSSIKRQGALVYDSANDGSGSGDDADMVDGLHASAFARSSDFSTGSNGNGRWWRRPDGAGGSVIEQKGFVGPTSPPGGQGVFTINFPTAFLGTDYDLQLTTRIPAAGDYDNFFQEISGTRTTTSVQVYSQDPSDGGLSNSAGFNWSARGY